MSIFYVSPNGGNSATGSAASPFATLAQALAATRATAGTDTIVVNGGTYALATPLALTAADSGITIVAAAGQTAILDGGGKQQSLIKIDGASNVTVQGLTFQNTAAGSDNDLAPAAILVNGARGVSVLGNVFNGTAKGVVASGGTTALKVDANSFANIANAAVDLDSQTSGNTVTNNTITHSGYGFPDEGGAIEVFESAGNLIAHNAISDVARNGIELQNYDPDNPSGGNTVEYNVIQHVMQKSTDGGAIYEFSSADQKASGDTIRYNKIVDTGPNLSWGIYMDDYTNNAQIYGNFVQKAHDGGVMLHGGDNNQVFNNVLIDNGTYGFQVMQIDGDGMTMEGNAIHNNLVAMQAGSQGPIWGADPMTPALVHDNIYVTPNGAAPLVGYDRDSYASWTAQGGDKGSDVVASAGFANAAGGNYAFAPGAFALTQGMSQLPFSQMGPIAGAVATSPTTPTTPPVTPPVTTPAPTPAPVTVGIDTLILQLSGDAYRGLAQFIVKVDGKQLAAAQAVQASHGLNQKQAFTYTHDWAPGTHQVEIDFVNDLSGRNGDRDLWVNSVSYDGKSYGPASAVELHTNNQPFLVAVVGQ